MPYTLTNTRFRLPSTNKLVGTGWLPPMYDPRDFTPKHEKVKPLVDKLTQKSKKLKKLTAPPTAVDLRPWCSPIEDQGGLGSCTANAAAGIVEYFQRRSFGKHLDASRLFIYKTTRNLMGVTGDTGAWLRNTMAALVLCGAAPEHYWQYTDQTPEFDREPPAFIYSMADNFDTVKYFCHDPLAGNVPLPDVLKSVKKFLEDGVPSMFGFWGFPSFGNADKPEHIPLPTDFELQAEPEWGHAIVAIGYDDQHAITNTVSNVTTTGAFLIRNSWGTSWGDQGYGWMPYDYLLKEQAMDFWSMLSSEWVDIDQFYL